MKQSQKLRRQGIEARKKLRPLVELDDPSKEDLDRIEELKTRIDSLDSREAAAILLEDREADAAAKDRDSRPRPDAEQRERIELRRKARLQIGLLFAGQHVDGALRELQQASGCELNDMPLEAWDVPDETRAATPAPSTVGVNLDPLRPMVFAPSLAPRLMIDMPTVQSGTYATGTLSTAATAGSVAKGTDVVQTAAAFTMSTTTPHRYGGSVAFAIEDVASVGAPNFVPILMENLSLVMSDTLDDAIINGDQSPTSEINGLLNQLADPVAPDASVATWLQFMKTAASGIEGKWAATLSELAIVVNPETYRLAASTFQGTDSELSAAASLNKELDSFWTNARLPDKAAHIAQAVMVRKGQAGMRRAVLPRWPGLSVDDRYTLGRKGQRQYSVHVLLGDLILVQPDAFKQISFRVST